MNSSAARALSALVLSLAFAGSAAAHVGHSAQVGIADPEVELRSCFLTTVLVPRPAEVLQPVFERPLDLSRTFYGPDPLLGIWGFDCERAVVEGKRVGRLITSLVGVPTALTSAGALANNFAHALIRIDTNSRVLARALRRAGLPGKRARKARYRHSPPGVVPSSGRLVVPERYKIDVSARDLDPTNPHDHLNSFEHLDDDGDAATLTLSSQDAFDRFCFPAAGNCSATIKAPTGSAIGRLLGGRTAPVRVGFDHEKLAEIDIGLSGSQR
jgi:hypothetical protein